jgi:hypothetical protein
MLGHFPGPRLAGHVQKQSGGNFQHVEQAAHEGDAGHAGPALAHLHAKLGHFESAAVQQQNHFGLGVIVGIPMGECLDHPAVDHAETAGAIGDGQAAEQADQGAEDADADGSADGLFVATIAEESRADDHVGVGFEQPVDQSSNFTGPVLAVAVDLDGYVVPVQSGVAITSLHRAPDAEVEWQTDHGGMGGHLAQRVIGRSIINHQHIEVGQRALEAMRQFADGLAFVEGWDNDQTA